jgi:hypothetical protein
MLGCIIQHDKRGLVHIGYQLIAKPNDVIVFIENFVVVSKMVPLLLWTECPDGARHQPSLVLWLLWHFHSRIGSLDGCTEAVPPPLVLFLLVDHILVVVGVPETVFIPMVMLMDVTLICAHLSEPLSWRLGSIGKEGAQVVVLLCNIGLRRYKIPFVLAMVVSTKLHQPPLLVPVRSFEGPLLI